MPDIISPQNPQIKRIVRLRQEKHEREKEGVVVVEGQYEIELALASGLRPLQVFHCAELSGGKIPGGLDISPLSVGRSAFEKMSYREGPDGWLALFPLPRRSLESLTLSAAPLIVVAESIEKPGNLGAILRAADAAAVDALLLCDPGVDVWNPNVVRASRGALFTVPVATTDNASALDWLKRHGIQVLAATPQAETLYTSVDMCQPLAIAVGAEDQGLSAFWLQRAKWRVRIPMWGKVNSLNVSVATALLVYEAARQRMKK